MTGEDEIVHDSFTIRRRKVGCTRTLAFPPDLRPPRSALPHPVIMIFSERELMFTFAICRRPSVCRLSVVCLSVCRLSVCLSSVTFVHPTQAIEIFGNVSTPFGSLAICYPSVKILRRSSHGNPSVGGLNQRGVEKCSDFDLGIWHFPRLYLGNGAR